MLEMLERDVELLQMHNVMDYSLLFAIEKNPNYFAIKGKKTNSTTSNDDELDKECKIGFK
jgi:hypothetical protein